MRTASPEIGPEGREINGRVGAAECIGRAGFGLDRGMFRPLVPSTWACHCKSFDIRLRPVAFPRRFPKEPCQLGRGSALAKPQWGIKRICHSCGTRFYDLMHDPIICPSCGAQFDPEALLRTRRSRAVVSEREPAVVADAVVREPEAAEDDADVEPDVAEEAAEEEEEGEAVVIVDEGDADETGEEEEEEEDLIEDASELGEDEDDMAEVIDQVDPESDR
jgi:uncharacterized protein (TIGR02300 family)